MGIQAVIERMRALEVELAESGDARQAFHSTYLRTTEAVAAALTDGVFADPDWVDRWDVAFAGFYLDALSASRRGEPVPGPWEVAFGAARGQPGLPPLRHVLLGMNAHINFDLPQALLAVISDAEFHDPAELARREEDHRRIDEVLSARVGAEDEELKSLETARTLQDRLLQPLNRIATRRFLRESRAKVWANAATLSRAREQGRDAYDSALADLERLSRARVADLERPGPVLLRLATSGFGVLLGKEPDGAPSPGDVGTEDVPEGAGHGVAPTTLGGLARLGGSLTGLARRRAPGGPRSFDPLRVGRLECAVWVAYYRRQWARFLVMSVLLVRYAFGMDWVRTVHGAWLVLRANQLWAPADNDPAGSRRCMRRFYALLRLSYGEPADPAEAARLEVAWWAVHRAHQKGESPDVRPLVAALAALYAYVYDVEADDVRAAAQQRAVAMDYSDEWVAMDCPAASPLLAAERAALVRSYAALLAAVHR